MFQAKEKKIKKGDLIYTSNGTTVAWLGKNAMVMAINIYFLTSLNSEENVLAYAVISFNVLFSALSAVLCLFIVDIFGPHIIDNYDVDQYIEKTLKTVCKRTHIFRLALVMSRIHGIILFFIYAFLLFGLL